MRKREAAQTEAEVTAAEEEHKNTIDIALQELTAAVQQTVNETIENKPAELVENLEKCKAEKDKNLLKIQYARICAAFRGRYQALLWLTATKI